MLYHIAYGHEWRAAQQRGEYITGSLDTDGFIHCSTREQVLIPANAMYRGIADLVLLCLDDSRITAPIVYEDCYESGIAFPHVYGTLNLDAVVEVLDFVPQADGTFVLPEQLSR